MLLRLMQASGFAGLGFGLFFAAQGFGLIRWPASSFMVGATNWIYYGAAIAVAGLILIRSSRRL